MASGVSSFSPASRLGGHHRRRTSGIEGSSLNHETRKRNTRKGDEGSDEKNKRNDAESGIRGRETNNSLKWKGSVDTAGPMGGDEICCRNTRGCGC